MATENDEPIPESKRRLSSKFGLKVAGHRPVIRKHSLAKRACHSAMFIRFVTGQLDEDTSKPRGIFAAAYELLENGALAESERAEIRRTIDWFKSNLPIPGRFVRSRKPHREDNGLCWFKCSATECMSHIRYLVQLVTDHDVVVRDLTTDKPGYLIYEDDSQVVAKLFSSTPQ